MGTIIPEGQFLKVELTPDSKSDPQNVIWSSTLSLNLTSILTPNQTLGLSHNRHYYCLLKHLFLLPFYQNSNFVCFILIMTIKFTAPSRRTISYPPGTGLEMNM